MSDRNVSYRLLARKLKGLRRHDFLDLLAPVVSASAAVRALNGLVAAAEAADDVADARRLKIEALQARASYERALHVVIEAVSDPGLGGDDNDLVADLLGGDNRTLAEILLSE